MLVNLPKTKIGEVYFYTLMSSGLRICKHVPKKGILMLMPKGKKRGSKFKPILKEKRGHGSFTSSR